MTPLVCILNKAPSHPFFLLGKGVASKLPWSAPLSLSFCRPARGPRSGKPRKVLLGVLSRVLFLLFIYLRENLSRQRERERDLKYTLRSTFQGYVLGVMHNATGHCWVATVICCKFLCCFCFCASFLSSILQHFPLSLLWFSWCFSFLLGWLAMMCRKVLVHALFCRSPSIVRREFRGKMNRGNRTESLWEGNLPLRLSLRGRVFRGFSEVLRGF